MRHALKFLFAVIVMLVLRNTVFAQSNGPVRFTDGISGLPNGEKILRGIKHGDADHPDHFFLATENRIQEVDISDDFYGMEFAVGAPSYTPPNGVKIKSVNQKVGYSNVYLVGLSDGKTIILHEAPNGTLTSENPDIIPIKGSESVKEIAGDALYALTTSLLYVLRDPAGKWQIDTLGLRSPYVYHIALDSSQNVYATNLYGLYKQGADSSRWYHIPSSAQAANALFVDRINRVWVRFDDGIYKSTDEGATWSIDTVGIGKQSIDQFGDDVFGNIYAMNGNQIFFRAHQNAVWTRIDLPISSGFLERNVTWFTGISGDTDIFLGTWYGLYGSSDQGGTWRYLGGPPAADIHGYARMQSGRKIASTNIGISNRSPEDTSWTRQFPTASFAATGTIYTDELNDAFTDFGVGLIYHMWWRSTDEGRSWFADTSGAAATFLAYSNSVIDENGGIHAATRSTNSVPTSLAYYKPRNADWTIDTAGIPLTNGSMTEALGNDGNGFVYISGHYINGGVWQAPPIMRKPIAGGAWQADTAGYAIHRVVPTTFYPLGKSGIIGTTGTAAIIRESTGVWRKITLPSTPDFAASRQFVADSDGTIFCSTTGTTSNFLPIGRGVFFSSDRGTTWTKLGLDSIVVNGFAQGKDTLFVYTQNGLYGIVAPPPVTVSSVQVSIDSSWNLVSVPFTRNNNAAGTLFPTRIPGSTYEYKKSYVGRDTLVPGKGYWTKFPNSAMDTISGLPLASAVVDVDSGWNIIGSVDHLTAAPSGGIITSSVYGYSHGYTVATNLVPGKGYWVKTNGTGSLMLGAGNAPKSQPLQMSDLNMLIIADAAGNSQTLFFGAGQPGSADLYELPPPPPSGMFDARFSTQHVVELADPKVSRTIGVTASAAAYPLTLSWKLNSNQHGITTLVAGNHRVTITANGNLRVSDPHTQIALELSPAIAPSLPKEFALDQSYPNPFNPEATIRYALPTDSRSRLTVFNVLGQEVIKLVDADQNAGEYHITFNGSNLPSGLYFYRLDAVSLGNPAERFTQTREMMLVK